MGRMFIVLHRSHEKQAMAVAKWLRPHDLASEAILQAGVNNVFTGFERVL